MASFNKIGFLLRILGIVFTLCGLYLEWILFVSYPTIGEVLFLGVPGILLAAFGVLMIVKTPAALRIAELIALVGAPLLGVILVFVARHEESFGHPGMGLFFFLPFYIPVVIFLQWLISSELDKSRKNKRSSFYKFLLPAILVFGSYIIALLIFPSLPF
ncbi:MAG TPA: hypothetical protein VGA53_03350 [Candidatus Paceibacterota bacterium]